MTGRDASPRRHRPDGGSRGCRIGDRKPGQILCQNVKEFGGVWRVVRPDGSLLG
jgi:hypothetical protein